MEAYCCAEMVNIKKKVRWYSGGGENLSISYMLIAKVFTVYHQLAVLAAPIF